MRKQLLFCTVLLMGLFVLQIDLLCAEINPDTAQKLIAEDGAHGDELGEAVSVSGNTALIGASNYEEKGAAYVFVRSSTGKWTQQAKLTANDGSVDDKFGTSVSIDGNTALIGAYANDDKGNMSGAVYVFVRSSDGSWTQQAKLTANDGGELDFFGCSVSLDGDNALIGADNDNITGSAYIFKRSIGGIWTQQAKLTADNDFGDRFGCSVSLDGSTALIGAYDHSTSDDQLGAAYIFVRSSDGAWTQQAKLTADNGNRDDGFGYSVSLDGSTALVSADADEDKGYLAGAVYVFERALDGSWAQQAKLTADDADVYTKFGRSTAVEGDTALIGTWGNNSVYVFVRSMDGTWIQQAKLVGTLGSIFGYSVSLDGGTALIGAPWDDNGEGMWPGSAYIYIIVNDADNDGIADGKDQCPATASGDVVNSAGCSIVQLCPCDINWKNRGRYIQCIQQASRKFMAAKLITRKDEMKIMKSAVKSQCGRKK